MSLTTQNLDRLERVLTALNGESANIGFQPSTIRPSGKLWSVDCRINGAYYYGAGGSLVEALTDLKCIAEAKSPADIAALEKVAA